MAASRVLFICTHNSARSQMAEGLARTLGAGAIEAASAGTESTVVRPEAIEAMAEIGVDISAHESRSIDRFRGQRFDVVVTVCDDARESCPFFPASALSLHWSLPDPSAVQGPGRLQAFRDSRDELRRRIMEELLPWIRSRSAASPGPSGAQGDPSPGGRGNG